MSDLKELDPVTLSPAPDVEAWRQTHQVVMARTRRRKLWRRPVVTIPVLIALSGAGLLFATAIARDKVIVVHAADALRDPRAVERQLAREGIDATIMSVPSSELAGKWYHLHLNPSADVDANTFALLRSYVGLLDMRYPSVQNRCPIGDCERTAVLEIPARVKGPLTLVVGRTPRGEEDDYWADSFGANELAPAGALWCYRLEQRTPAKAESILRDLGYDVVWMHENDERSDVVKQPPDDAVITAAGFRGPNVIDVRTASPNDAARYMRANGTPTDAHPRSSVTWAPACQADA